MKPETLSRNALNRALLARQMLLAREELPPRRAIERLVALQAQQAQPPFVGVWTRVAGFDREALLGLVRGREVVRATLMRGTLHLAAADDYLALRGPLQPMLSAGMRSVLRGRAEGLDLAAVLAEARRSFGEGGPQTFTEVRAALVRAFPDADERAMGYAVRTHLPLVAVPDDAADWGFRADPRFTPAESWLGRAPDQCEGEGENGGVETLVLRYLAAFGPAAAADVQAWSGLGGAEVRPRLEALRPRLRVFRDDRKRELFDLPEAPRPPEDAPGPARFLPGFDNLILSHADRSRIIADEHRPRVTTKNLLVLPTFLVDGFVAGTWACTRSRGDARLTVSPFAKLPATARGELTREGQALLRFLEPDAGKTAIDFETP